MEEDYLGGVQRNPKQRGRHQQEVDAALSDGGHDQRHQLDRVLKWSL